MEGGDSLTVQTVLCSLKSMEMLSDPSACQREKNLHLSPPLELSPTLYIMEDKCGWLAVTGFMNLSNDAESNKELQKWL